MSTTAPRFTALRRRRCRLRPRSSSTSPACTKAPASTRRTSSPSSTPRTAGSSTKCRCRTRRRAPPLRLEPLLVGVPRPRPLAPDRPRVPLVANPHRQRRRRPAPTPDREGDRAGRGHREDGLHEAAHRPLHAGRQHRRLDARRCRRQRRRRLRRPRREDVRGQGPLGERRRAAAAQLRLLVPAAQERARLDRVRRAECLRARLRPRRRRGRPVRAAHPLLEPRDAHARADRGPRREGPHSARGAVAARSRRGGGLRRRRALERRCGTSTATTAPGRPIR